MEHQSLHYTLRRDAQTTFKMLVPYRPNGNRTSPIFIGRSYQRGRGFGSTMSSIFRNFIVPAAKDVGKSLLKTGLRKTSGVLKNVADGKGVKQAFKDEFLGPINASSMKRGNTRKRKKKPLSHTAKKRKRVMKSNQRDIFG